MSNRNSAYPPLRHGVFPHGDTMLCRASQTKPEHRTSILLRRISMATLAVESTTLQHLQTAYDGESNARIRYRLFAVQANIDGYRDVASLFRAAARAEQIHAENHARVIRSMGADPKCIISPVDVRETAANLREAIKGEEHE